MAKSDGRKHPPVDEYKPGQLVLSKVGSYPPWPAVVIPLAYVPRDVIKNSKTDAVPVKYFNDPTWYWNTRQSISPLDKAAFERFQKNPPTPTKNLSLGEIETLTDAYSYAEEYEGLDTFLEEIGVLTGEYVDYESWRDEGSTAPLPNKRKGRKSSVVEDQEVNEPKKKKAKETPVKEPKANKRTPPVSKKQQQAQQKVKQPPKPTFEDLTHKAIGFRSKLQRGLIQRTVDPTEEELASLSDILKDLEEFSDTINTELLKLSKLHKVLKAIKKVDKLERPNDFRFHERCGELLLKWDDLITELKSEKNGGNGRNDTPNSSTLDLHESTPKKENGVSKSETLRNSEPLVEQTKAEVKPNTDTDTKVENNEEQDKPEVKEEELDDNSNDTAIEKSSDQPKDKPDQPKEEPKEEAREDPKEEPKSESGEIKEESKVTINNDPVTTEEPKEEIK